MSLNNTPSANRLHIAIFGRQNSGKSTLLNAITNQDLAIVSQHKGATTDPVYKAMEIARVGPCMLIDTAGFDDSGELGELRVQKTRAVLDKADIAIILVSGEELTHEKEWLGEIIDRKIAPIVVINDFGDGRELSELCEKELCQKAITVNAKTREGIDGLLDEILAVMPEKFDELSITAEHVSEGDVVLLVMPQDIGAPKGRLILPQVQTTRDLLDNGCIVLSVTHDKMEAAILKLAAPPDLIITDSQVFPYVYERKPQGSRLTSFSVLFAAYKGDKEVFLEGLKNFGMLPSDKKLKVLIAEACTHAPQTEDIGRVKIPNMLKKRFGERIAIEVCSGTDFPHDLSEYDLVIHCGGCMFNRRVMLSRIGRIKRQGVNITNYGMFLADAAGILDKIDL